jgi:uncharacterized membrane protein (DUF4010 family)
MPWTSEDAHRHTHKANSPKAQRQWAHIADSALSRGASEKSAIMQANGVVAHRHAAGGAISPLASLVGNPMAMRSTMPHLATPIGTAGRARMPRVPLMDTMHNIDEHMAGAKVKLPKLKAKMGGRARRYADGGAIVSLGERAMSAVKDALSHLANNDASSAAATLRASREAMQHPTVAQAAQSLRSSSGIAPATRNLTGVVNANTDRVIMPTVGGQ